MSRTHEVVAARPVRRVRRSSSAPAPARRARARASAAPSTARRASAAEQPAATSAAADAGVALPGDGDAPAARAAGYTGEFSRIKAVDAQTVEFDLCAPDVAFLPKIAFASFGIQDSDWLASTRAGQVVPHDDERHRPLHAQGVGQGQPHRPRGQPELLGHEGPDAEPRAPLERHRGPAPAATCSPAPSTASTTPAPTTITTVKADSILAFYGRDALNVAVPRASTSSKAPWDNEKVRQAIAMGIDRERIANELLPGRLGRRRLLHPVRRSCRSAARAMTGTRSTRRPPRSC